MALGRPAIRGLLSASDADADADGGSTSQPVLRGVPTPGNASDADGPCGIRIEPGRRPSADELKVMLEVLASSSSAPCVLALPASWKWELLGEACGSFELPMPLALWAAEAWASVLPGQPSSALPDGLESYLDCVAVALLQQQGGISALADLLHALASQGDTGVDRLRSVLVELVRLGPLAHLEAWKDFWTQLDHSSAASLLLWKTFLAAYMDVRPDEVFTWADSCAPWFDGAPRSVRYLSTMGLLLRPLAIRETLTMDRLVGGTPARRLAFLIATPIDQRYPFVDAPPLLEAGRSVLEALMARGLDADPKSAEASWRSNLIANLWRFVGHDAALELAAHELENGIDAERRPSLAMWVRALLFNLHVLEKTGASNLASDRADVKERGARLLREAAMIEELLRTTLSRTSDANIKVIDVYLEPGFNMGPVEDREWLSTRFMAAVGVERLVRIRRSR